MTKFVLALSVAMGLTAPASAQTWSNNAPKIGPVNQPEGILIETYPVTTNHCHAGYQPVVVGGVISCGKPVTAQGPKQSKVNAPQS